MRIKEKKRRLYSNDDKSKIDPQDFELDEVLRVKFRRPPETKEEIMKTLGEADKRFDRGLKYLKGKDGNLKP